METWVNPPSSAAQESWHPAYAECCTTKTPSESQHLYLIQYLTSLKRKTATPHSSPDTMNLHPGSPENHPTPHGRRAETHQKTRRRYHRQSLRQPPDGPTRPLPAPLPLASHHLRHRRCPQGRLRRRRPIPRQGRPRSLPHRRLRRQLQLDRPPSPRRRALRTRRTRPHLSHRSPHRLRPRIHPDLPHAVDRPKGHVRPPPRNLPPHAAHAHRLL